MFHSLDLSCEFMTGMRSTFNLGGLLVSLCILCGCQFSELAPNDQDSPGEVQSEELPRLTAALVVGQGWSMDSTGGWVRGEAFILDFGDKTILSAGFILSEQSGATFDSDPNARRVNSTWNNFGHYVKEFPLAESMRNKVWYLRPFAQSDKGTGYGEETTFRTFY